MKTILTLLLISVKLFAQTNPTMYYLDKNKVKTKINTANDKFWNITGNGAPSYEVPVGQGKHTMCAGSIWIGGLDAGGQLKVAANTYKQSGADFWPGPLDTLNYNTNIPANSSAYNRLWKTDCNDIGNFVTAYSNGSVTAGTYTVPPDILNYPAIGTSNYQRNLSPFVDANNNNIYDPIQGGDYPIIKGHQQILSIFNDNYSIHYETQGASMGVEIHERSYAYHEPNIADSMQAINYTTFYHYTIYNRSPYNYNNVLLANWTEFLLGNYLDNFIGSDTLNDFAYCYNADSLDENVPGLLGYGNRPPVMSIAILPTDCSSDGIDNNHDGQIDEAGEQFKLDRFTYYNINNVNLFPIQTVHPGTALHYYNYMNGFWKDNSPFTFGGNGYGGTTPSPRVYPGDPQNQSGWTEASAGNTPTHKRVLISSGPFSFPANSKIEWGYALVFSQDTTAGVNTITQFNERVKRDVRNIKHYDATMNRLQCAPTLSQATTVGIAKNKPSKLNASIYPNPVNEKLTIELNENATAALVHLVDVSGRIIQVNEIKNSYRTELDVSELQNGIYFVEIKTENKVVRQKIIKN